MKRYNIWIHLINGYLKWKCICYIWKFLYLFIYLFITYMTLASRSGHINSSCLLHIVQRKHMEEQRFTCPPLPMIRFQQTSHCSPYMSSIHVFKCLFYRNRLLNDLSVFPPLNRALAHWADRRRNRHIALKLLSFSTYEVLSSPESLSKPRWVCRLAGENAELTISFAISAFHCSNSTSTRAVYP